MTFFALGRRATVALSLLLAGCGGSGHGFSAGTPFVTGIPSIGPAASTIGGVINTNDFVVPSGKSTRISKNTEIFAATSVQIAGTLVVPRGISVAFFTPSFTLAAGGSIDTAANKNYKGPVDDLISACQINLSSGSSWSLGAGDNIGLTSSKKSKPQKPCVLRIAGMLQIPPGATGGTDKKRPNGQNGGAIVVGTKEAIDLTEELAKTDGHRLSAFSPGVVDMSAPLKSGAGGDGKADPAGSDSGGGHTFTAGNGGIGGVIEITADKITGKKPTLQAGNGGNGGALAAGFFGDGYYEQGPLDGTADSPNGVDATLVMGAGGGGGSILIKASAPKNAVEKPGNGGSPSTVYGATRSGSDIVACSNCFLAGAGYDAVLTGASSAPHGGSLTVYLPGVGKKGVGGKSNAKNGKYAALTFGGGRGGVSIDQTLQIAKGGDGGSLTIVPPPHVAPSSLKQFKLKIIARTFGNGVASGGNCNIGGAHAPGPDGGNGGDLHDNGLIDFITVVQDAPNHSTSFNAGDGAGGDPAGNPGTPGHDDEGNVVGSPGIVGQSC